MREKNPESTNGYVTVKLAFIVSALIKQFYRSNNSLSLDRLISKLLTGQIKFFWLGKDITAVIIQIAGRYDKG